MTDAAQSREFSKFPEIPEFPEISKSCLSVRGLRSDHGGPFDLELARGECVCVLGASGAGKSVLLRLIADMDPGTGYVSLNGQPRQHGSGPEWRRRVVYQAAEPAWWAPLVADHFPQADLALTQSLTHSFMHALGLSTALLAQAVDLLSTGERQRLALVRSLVHKPMVLLLDEPTASLDPESIAAVEALLKKQLHAGISILMVTHSREQALRISDRQMELRDHQLNPVSSEPKAVASA